VNNYSIIGFSLLLIVAISYDCIFYRIYSEMTGYVTKAVGVNITVGTPAIITVHNYTLLSNTLTAGPLYTTFIIKISVSMMLQEPLFLMTPLLK